MLQLIRKAIIDRSFTNLISYTIDNLIPPILRDNKYFMYPFYRLAFKGNDVKAAMEFKSRLYSVSPADLEVIYQNYNTIGTERLTDLNKKSISHILKHINPGTKTILDIACGKGYLAGKLSKAGYSVSGADVFEKSADTSFQYFQVNIEKLPFADNSFDTVISTHTLEHVINIRQAVRELKRVAAKQLIVVVPCQRFYYYTLDHHLHFFPKKEMLAGLMNTNCNEIQKIGGDWVLVTNSF
jgi:SAM-dependent methyltransferase